jgi:hypothetical protein
MAYLRKDTYVRPFDKKVKNVLKKVNKPINNPEPIDANLLKYDLDENENINMNLVSNILENFEDIDPQEQSMFLNLNIRNRR